MSFWTELSGVDPGVLWSFGRASLAAMTVALLLTPCVRRIALLTGTVDHPNDRRINKVNMPTAGGLAMVAAFWVGGAASNLLGEATGALIWGSAVIVVTGILDDRIELRPKWKFAGQVLAALIVVAGGLRIEFMTNPFGGMWYLGWLGVPLTVLWIVALTNVINFIDGLDGLAAGVSAIACAPLFLVALQRGHLDAAAMTVALFGAALGFLRYNFNPAKIIMGDTGAMFLGFVLAVASILGAMKGAATVAMAIPTVALGVPIFDTAFAVFRRVRSGKPFYAADRGHLHHRLLAVGYSQRQAVAVMYGMASVLGVAALMLAFSDKATAVVALLAVVAAAVSLGWRLQQSPSQTPPKSGGTGITL